MKIAIDIDSGTTIGKYSEIFREIVQTQAMLGRSGGLIEHAGVKRVYDSQGDWQLVLTITFRIPLSKHDKRKWKVEKYLDINIPGCRLMEIMTEETKSFIKARIAEAKNNSTNLESYSVVGPLN
ncbi:hypothetical protein EB001_05790 [bacterium]|nr:hypothetical protein [bacterium]